MIPQIFYSTSQQPCIVACAEEPRRHCFLVLEKQYTTSRELRHLPRLGDNLTHSYSWWHEVGCRHQLRSSGSLDDDRYRQCLWLLALLDRPNYVVWTLYFFYLFCHGRCCFQCMSKHIDRCGMAVERPTARARPLCCLWLFCLPGTGGRSSRNGQTYCSVVLVGTQRQQQQHISWQP